MVIVCFDVLPDKLIVIMPICIIGLEREKLLMPKFPFGKFDFGMIKLMRVIEGLEDI